MFGALEPRTIICNVCKKSEKEVFYGLGFSGWLRIMDIFDSETKQNPMLCPKCKAELLGWINGNAKIILNEIKSEEKK